MQNIVKLEKNPGGRLRTINLSKYKKCGRTPWSIVWGCLNNVIFFTSDHVRWIDYEYASMNYLPFDIGNHFCEYAGMPNFYFRGINWFNSVLARPKRQGAAPYRFSVRPVVFLQRPVVFVILHIVLIKIWDKKKQYFKVSRQYFPSYFQHNSNDRDRSKIIAFRH